jgi:hypothetical protein
MYRKVTKRIDSSKLREEMEVNINCMMENILKEEESECSTLSFSSGFDESLGSYTFSRSSSMEIEDVLEKIKIKSKMSKHNYEKLSGSFLNLVKTQSGSRVLQSILSTSHPEVVKSLFYELKANLPELIIDPYANYFCPKLFSVLKTEEKIQFLLEIQYNVLEIGVSKIGTYPLQMIIGNLTTPNELNIMVNACCFSCIQLCQDPQGVHVIEKFITTYSDQSVFKIYDILIKNLSYLSMNVNGLCVTKKIVTQSKNILIKLLVRDAIKEDAINLVQHVYGNYIIQTALDHWDVELLVPISQKFYGSFHYLSMQKYSSNVLEKCFEKMHDFILLSFIEETSKNIKVIDLMRHSYGNYVIQKAIKLSHGVCKKNYISLILRNINKLGDKKLIFKWSTIIENACSEQKEGTQNTLKVTNILNNNNQKNYKNNNKQNLHNNCTSNFSLNNLSGLNTMHSRCLINNSVNTFVI